MGFGTGIVPATRTKMFGGFAQGGLLVLLPAGRNVRNKIRTENIKISPVE